MSIFDNIKNLFGAKHEKEPYSEASAMELSEIFALEDTTDFLIAINDRLNQRTDYGDRIDLLSPEEQVFYICNLVMEEVNNGGFDQFLYNSSGDHAHRAEDCLRTIGANKTADICHTALSAFGKPIPRNRNQRQKFLDKMESDEISEILDDCDGKFYEYPDPLEELCQQYILANKSSFT